MTKIVATPSQHQVFNEFDKHGLLLGLSRLPGEKNAAYKRRLMDVFVHRANATYEGLINGITRELGLEISKSFKVEPVKDSNGDPLAINPAVIFEETKCYLYEDYANSVLLDTIDRFDLDGDAFTIGNLISEINNSGKYTATSLNTEDTNSRSMTIFNQRSVIQILAEDFSSAAGQYKLEFNNLIPQTASVISNNLTRRVSSQSEIVTSGDYYIDLTYGIIYMYGQASGGSIIRYQYRDDNFIVRTSPVIIHNLQSADFKTKMFEQLLDEDGNFVNGSPTALGADLINEILSVFPSGYGE